MNTIDEITSQELCGIVDKFLIGNRKVHLEPDILRFTSATPMVMGTPLDVKQLRLHYSPLITSADRWDGALLRDRRTFTRLTGRVNGVRTTYEWPWLYTPGGIPDSGVDDWNVTTLDAVNAQWTHCMGRRPAPWPSDGKGFTIHSLGHTIHASGSLVASEWEGGGSIIATLNKMIKAVVPSPLNDPLTTMEGNDLLALMSAKLSGMAIEARWVEGAISDAYNGERRMPYTSCMKGKPTSYFELYDHLQKRGQLRMIEVVPMEGGSRVARALVWSGTNPADHYLDRIYAEEAASSSDPRPDVVAEIARFCEQEGVTKTVFEQTMRLTGLEFVGLRVDTGASREDFHYYPYADSLSYFYEDGWLSTSSSRNGCYAELCSVEGGPYWGDNSNEDDDEYDENHVDTVEGDRMHEDEACYSDYDDEHHSEYAVVYSDWHGTWVPTSVAVRTVEGHVTWESDDDLVELSGDRYAFLGTVVKLEGDEGYAHPDEDSADIVKVGDLWYRIGTEPEGGDA